MQTEDSRKQKAENDVVLEKLKAEVQAMKDEHAAVTKQTAEEYASLKKQVEDDHAALKKKTEEEYLDLNSNLKSKHEELVKKLNDEHRELTAKIHEEHAVLTQKVKAEQETQAQQMKEELTALQKKLAETQSQESAIRAQLSTESHELESVRSELALKQDQKRILEEQTKGIQEQIAKFTSDHRSFEEKKNLIVQEYETQKRHLKDKLENEKTRLLKETEETSQHMKLEMNKRIQKLEQDLLDDLITKKESLGKELLNAVEARVVKSLDAGKWGQMSSQVYSDIKEVIEGKVITLSQSTVGTNKKPVDLAKKKRNESLRWISAGMAAGALLFFISSTAYHAMVNDQAPVQSRLDEENRRRQEDLAKRKFNPPQVPEVKDSYVDAVIYTQDYVKVYLDPEFQKKLYKAASAYLLKTWRVDEDQSIQVLSAAGALVKELAEKKEAIHPDFVKDGVDKMHQLEAETIARMKEILGSEVRLESFRRFERRFVTEEGRQVASTPPAQE